MAVAERAASAGIRERWQQLYADYYKFALGLARQWVHSQADAEDAAQLTFMNVYDILASDKPVENWEAMIATIAKRQAGKARASVDRTAALEPEVAVDQVAERDAAERREAFEATFGSLSEAEQQAVYFTLVEGLSANEVGERLGTSADSARHLLSRGRARLVLEMVTRNVAGEAAADDRPLSDICRYLANRMSGDERREFADHLKSCARCRMTVERVREFRGFVLLLLPAGLVALYGDHLYAQIEAQPVASKSSQRGVDRRLVAAGLVLVLLLITGGVVIQTRKPAPAQLGSPALAASGCPTGKLGGFAYIDGGNVVYRSSPTASPQEISSSGHADDLMWTPDGTTLVYKDARRRGPVAGTLYAVHPGSSPFWSFGTAIDSFAISPDGKQFAALTEHDDAFGNWTGWTLHIGALGVGSPGAERTVATPIPDQWQDAPTGEPQAESIYVPTPGHYWGVFWLAHTIYIADDDHVASYDEAANPISGGWGAPPAAVQSLLDGIAQPEKSDLHYAGYGAPVTLSCGSTARSLDSGTAFARDGVGALTMADDPKNPRAALVAAASQSTGTNIYLATADGTVTQLTTDGRSYLPVWQP